LFFSLRRRCEGTGGRTRRAKARAADGNVRRAGAACENAQQRGRRRTSDAGKPSVSSSAAVARSSFSSSFLRFGERSSSLPARPHRQLADFTAQADGATTRKCRAAQRGTAADQDTWQGTQPDTWHAVRRTRANRPIEPWDPTRLERAYDAAPVAAVRRAIALLRLLHAHAHANCRARAPVVALTKKQGTQTHAHTHTHAHARTQARIQPAHT
jgi:hypothetical protein